MKFLILFACIAAASAVFTSYPWKYGGEVFNKYVDPLHGVDYHKYDRDFVGGYGLYNRGYYGKSFLNKDIPFYGYGKDFYHKEMPFYGKDFYHKEMPFYPGYGKEFYHKEMPFYPSYGKDFVSGVYNKDFYGYGHHDLSSFNIGSLLGDKDISVIKKDFVIVYYKYLLEIMELFKVRFGDILVHSDTFVLDKFTLPTHCTKLSGLTRWMMTMSIDVTKYDIHFFDYFMMCKMYDYIMFIKYYWLHFDLNIMYKDFGLIRNFYGLIGDHGYGLHKYYGDVYGEHFGLGSKYHGLVHY